MLDSLNSHTVKNQIIDAANEVVLENGAAHLTFDAVVKKTGLSKGGILYHFPNKKALLTAMMNRMIVTFNDSRERIHQNMTTAILPNTKTYILAAHTKDEQSYKSDIAVLAAAANDPELMQPLQENFRRNFHTARSESNDPTLATLLCLAMDGIWLLSALGLNFASKQQLEDAVALALDLAENGRTVIK